MSPYCFFKRSIQGLSKITLFLSNENKALQHWYMLAFFMDIYQSGVPLMMEAVALNHIRP